MKQSLRLGRVAGITVGANWTVGVMLVIVTELLGASVLPAALPHQRTIAYWGVAAAGALLFAGSLLAHEVAHALVAARSGLRVRSITLWMLGGVTELDGDPPDARADLRIAIAGPATSLAAAAVFGAVALAVGHGGGKALITSTAAWLAAMNGLLAVFNMLPGAPLDGGRVLRAALWRRYGDRGRAAVAAARAGRATGAAIAVLGIAELLLWSALGGLWLILVGLFLYGAAGAEAAGAEAAAAVTSALGGVRVADVMERDPDVAPAWSTVQEFIDRVAARSRQDAFPVVGFEGGLAGLALRDRLAAVPADDRTCLRVARIAIAVPDTYRAGPADPAAPLLLRPPLGGEVVAVVLDHGQVTGLVTVADVRQALRLVRLNGQPAGPGRDPGHGWPQLVQAGGEARCDGRGNGRGGSAEPGAGARAGWPG